MQPLLRALCTGDAAWVALRERRHPTTCSSTCPPALVLTRRRRNVSRMRPAQRCWFRQGPPLPVPAVAAYLVCELVHGQVQLIGDGASRLTRPHHEHVRLAGTERALLPVVLLVGAMELHELHGLLANERVLVHKLLHQRVPKEVAVLLDNFHLAALGKARRRRLARRRDAHHMTGSAAGRRRRRRAGTAAAGGQRRVHPGGRGRTTRDGSGAEHESLAATLGRQQWGG
eukprot:364933-Chlamydomonas_euryale.AAC.8